MICIRTNLSTFKYTANWFCVCVCVCVYRDRYVQLQNKYVFTLKKRKLPRNAAHKSNIRFP